VQKATVQFSLGRQARTLFAWKNVTGAHNSHNLTFVPQTWWSFLLIYCGTRSLALRQRLMFLWHIRL